MSATLLILNSPRLRQIASQGAAYFLGNTMRDLAIRLLDDAHGINRQAWKLLGDILEDEGHQDITDAVLPVGDRWRLPPDHGLVA